MSRCCGQSRRKVSLHTISRLDQQTTQAGSALTAYRQMQTDRYTRAAEKPDISLTYKGKTRMVVVGPYTGRRYQFAGPGQEVPVDYRDADSLLKLKQLEKTGEK